MICRAKGCTSFAMPTTPDNPKGLCGFCHEQDEEYEVRIKPGYMPGSSTPEAIAARSETRKRNKAALIAKIRGEAA